LWRPEPGTGQKSTNITLYTPSNARGGEGDDTVWICICPHWRKEKNLPLISKAIVKGKRNSHVVADSLPPDPEKTKGKRKVRVFRDVEFRNGGGRKGEKKSDFLNDGGRNKGNRKRERPEAGLKNWAIGCTTDKKKETKLMRRKGEKRQMDDQRVGVTCRVKQRKGGKKI